MRNLALGIAGVCLLLNNHALTQTNAWLAATPPSAGQEVEPLQLVGTIPISGAPGGRSGVMMLDDTHHRLFVNGMGSSSFIDLIDLTDNKLINRICCFRQNGFKPGGMAFAASINTLFVNNGSNPPIRINGPDVLRDKLQIELPVDAGLIGLDEAVGRVYAGYGTASTGGIAAFTLSGDPIFNIRLGSYASGPEFSLRTPRMFASLDGQVAVINRMTGEAVTQFAGVSDPGRFALAVDEPRGRLLIGSRDGRLLAIDTANGRKLADVTIASGCDSLSIDSSRNRVYVVAQGKATGAGGSGSRTYAPDTYPAITVLDNRPEGQLRTIGKVRIGDYAETSIWSPSLGRLYVAIPGWSWQPNEIRVFSATPTTSK